MQSQTRSLIAAAAVSLLMSAHGVALAQAAPPQQSEAAISALVQQGRYWQTRQADRANEAWKKLLSIDSNNAEALAGLGRLAVIAKKPAEARGYLERLRAAHPDSPQLAKLEMDIDTGSATGQAELDDARLLVRQKRMDDAVAKYKALFKGREPVGPLAVEYYSVLGYTSGGRDEAIAGLQRILRTSPNDAQARTSLAGLRLLTEKTRLEAMRVLLAESRKPDGGAAGEQLRQSMGWLGSPPPAAYQPIFREYLAANPDDTELREQLAGRGPKLPGQGVAGRGGSGAGAARGAQGAPQPVVTVEKKLAPEALHTADGYALVRNNKYAEAEAEFTEAIRINPRYADAVGGLGLLRFKQERFSEAKVLLKRVYDLDGQEGWKFLLDTVTYWELIGQADVARNAGRFDEAERLLQQALSIKLEEEDTNAENRLASLYNDMDRPQDAERIYRKLLQGEPDDMQALSGLVGTLSKTGRPAEALALIEDMSTEQKERLDVNRLRAEVALAEGREFAAQGQDPNARVKFQQAVELQPDNGWMSLELARLERRNGARSSGSQLMDSLLARKPQDVNVLYTTALYRGDLRDWAGVLELMDRIPPAERTKAHATLQRAAAVHVQADQALALAHDGRRADADALLKQTASRLGDDADLLGIVAQAYVDMGDFDRARQLLRAAIERSARSPANLANTTALQLRYGGVLLSIEDDRGLADVLRQLQARSQASPLVGDDMIRFQSLRTAYIGRQAEALRKQKRLAEAYEVLRPALAATPKDPVLLGVLARMYDDAGQPQQARAIYRDMLTRNPDDVNTLVGAAGMASLQGDYRSADQLLTRAESLAPKNPDVLAGRGRLLRAQGKPGQAVAYLTQASEAVRERDPVLGAVPPTRNTGAGMAPMSADNPFATTARSVRSNDTPDTSGFGLPAARTTR